MSFVGLAAAMLAIYLAYLAFVGARLPMPASAGASWRTLALCAACGVAGLLVAGGAGLPLLGLVAGAAPWWWEANRRAARRRREEASALAVLESVAAASRAGLVLPDALAAARPRARGDLHERLDVVLARLRLGAAPHEVLEEAALGAPPLVSDTFADLAHCARLHLPAEAVAAYLEDVLGSRRFERELASDLRARTSGQRFQMWLLAAVVPLLTLYLAAMSPTLADQLASPLGRTVLVPGGALFELAGIVASRKVLEAALG